MPNQRTWTIVVALLSVLLTCGCDRLELANAFLPALTYSSGYVLGFLQGSGAVQWTNQTTCYRNGEPIDCSALPTSGASASSPPS